MYNPTVPIKLLDSKTVARIAAGEVVERPASVVKELIENALDAGARNLDIEIKGGGTGLIRVSDDGCGIAPADLPLVFTRHATSKITSFDDLTGIMSLGFRGEALGSITSVADVELLTAVANAPSGCLVIRRDGRTSDKPAARTRGTSISVSHLFKAVPARLKFLKTDATETGHIVNVVSNYALARPEVRFTLTVDGRRSLNTPGTGQLRDTAAEILGRETASRMIDVEAAAESLSVSGLAAPPDAGRANRTGLFFFVNQRWVKSPMLSRAVEEAYHGLLTVGRYPVAVINLTLPPADIDINIHPAKTEIKFHQDNRIFNFVRQSVRSALIGESPVPVIGEPVPLYRPSDYRQDMKPFVENLFPETAAPARSLPASGMTVARSLPALRAIGQVAGCYILAEGPDGLYIVDQHAAHERIMYEKVLTARQNHTPASQALLEPRNVELSPAEAAVVTALSKMLAEFGFVTEDFGGRTLLVRAVPSALAGSDWLTALHEFLNSPESRTRGEEKLAELIACHSAVRSGKSLTQEEIRALLLDLEKAEVPNTCPHGRPTLMKLETVALERHFKRT
ncbi:MAG: DNA mismatch repair endonuclease MutL [Dehalogenimonas sp.]|uniref:DNA mismatch repair protein MutL n=1 Tax=Candidatus Dehalogenimonas loeffleri TaxID=3127115 RepID=A0ABZ2J6Y1_9CHLR|nr:DNA mismatch repair endonuclease MutL [Dehalogenimonas sp.]